MREYKVKMQVKATSDLDFFGLFPKTYNLVEIVKAETAQDAIRDVQKSARRDIIIHDLEDNVEFTVTDVEAL